MNPDSIIELTVMAVCIGTGGLVIYAVKKWLLRNKPPVGFTLRAPTKGEMACPEDDGVNYPEHGCRRCRSKGPYHQPVADMDVQNMWQ